MNSFTNALATKLPLRITHNYAIGTNNYEKVDATDVQAALNSIQSTWDFTKLRYGTDYSNLVFDDLYGGNMYFTNRDDICKYH